MSKGKLKYLKGKLLKIKENTTLLINVGLFLISFLSLKAQGTYYQKKYNFSIHARKH
jgi:hypothetical protein